MKKAKSFDLALKVAPPARLELATYGLTVRRSTDWTKGELFFTYRGDKFERMVPTTGIELVTYWLQVSCSTYWAKSAQIFFLLLVLNTNNLNMVPRGGIEPPTRGFSILCSTDWAIEATGCIKRFFAFNVNTKLQKKYRLLLFYT